MRPTDITYSTTSVRCIEVPVGYTSFNLTKGATYRVLIVYSFGYMHIVDNTGRPLYISTSHFIPATPSAIYKRRR